MKFAVLVAVCLLSFVECKWRDQGKNRYGDPPDHTKLIPMARYVLHNSGLLNVKQNLS